MKKFLFTLCLFACNEAFAQISDKSRMLKYTTPLCPLDITKTFAKEGLLKANTETIEISKDSVYKPLSEDIERSDGTSILAKGTFVREYTYDTVLLRTILIERGFVFDIVQQIGSYSLIKFWPLRGQRNKGIFQYFFSAKDEKAKLDELSKASEYVTVEGLKLILKDTSGKDSAWYDLSESTYIVPTALLLSHSVEVENKNRALNIGLLALPVKTRPFATESGQFDFSDGFSVGTTLSYTIWHNIKTDFTHNALLYIGISSYTADSSKIKVPREDYKIAAFSPAIGWMWGKNNVQLSLLVGIDFPAGNLQKTWVYRNMPWIGLGVGIGLFKISNEEGTQGTNSN